MPTKTKTYPRPGTNAERILHYIRINPGASVTKIWNALRMNPSPTRTCITALLEHGLIEDQPDASGHHHFVVKDTVL